MCHHLFFALGEKFVKNLKEKYPDLVDDRKVIEVLKVNVFLYVFFFRNSHDTF